MKKRTLKKYANAGTVDKTGATVANVTNIAGTVIPIATSFLPKNNYTDNQGNVLGSTNSLETDVLNNAATGASLGSVFGPVGTGVGAALGAGWGAISNGMETNDMIDSRNRANIRNNNRSLSNKMLNNNNMVTKQNYNNDNMVFANGGMVKINQDMPNATEEVEGGESAITPNGQHIEFEGPTHEMGGIETNLPEETFIFSDRLKMGKKTFASLAKPIQNKITKLEENPSKFAKNSKELLTKQLDFLANNQEQLKQETDMKRSLKFAKGGMVKYDGGGPVVGSINPKTGTPFTKQEIDLYHSIPQTNRFGTEYVGAGSVKDGVQERLYRNIPEANMGAAPNSKPQYVPSNTYQADYENNLQNLRKGQFDYENTLYNGLPKNPSFNLQQPVGPNKPIIPVLNQEKYINSTQPKTNSFNNVDYNELGQIGASVGSNFAQVNRINNMAKPRTLNNVRLQPGMTNPKYVNLSGQRNAISKVAKSAMDEAGRNFGNSASIQAFKNKARLNELQGLGESYQNQENTNAGIFNQYANQRNEMAAKEALTNAEIDKYNIDAAYGDAASRVSGKNAASAQLGNTVGQVFGNRTAYKNQLDQANILKNSYNPEVINRAIENGELVYRNGKLEAKAYGGKIKKRSLKK